MNRVLFSLALLTAFALYGCPPPPYVEPAPGPRHVPPGQIQRQMTPSGPKPVPPGQMRRVAPSPSPVVGLPVPPLPPVVVFDVEPVYFHEGYYYHYEGGVWYYSESRGGPKVKLPKGHYPKEVRFKGKGKGEGRGKGRFKD